MSTALPPLSTPMTAAAVSAAAARTRFRRALALTAMTVLLPGSAQLVAGNKRTGRIAMRAFAAALAFVLVLAVVALFWQPTMVRLATSMWFLGLLRVGLAAYAVVWAYLLIDAWRISEPLELGQKQRLCMTALNGILCFGLSGALLYGSHLVAVQRDFITSVFTSGTVTEPEHGRYNILLLGGDAGPDRVGIRPDSITVASVDEETGRTVLFGLPRNLANVPFPKGSPMHQEFPHGFRCDGCYLNAVNTWATDHANLYPGFEHPGIEATTQAVEEITGLSINYYVLIDLAGFRKLVDAVGGVTINVHERTPIGGIATPVREWIEPGRRHLDGYQTLWYSRSRVISSDYSRMGRQKCVMNAMLHQLDPQTVLTRFGAIADAGKQVLSTSIPASQVATFVNLALKTKKLPVTTVSFVPPTVNTSDPDFDQIRTMVTKAIEASQAKDDGTAPARQPHKGKKKRDANDSTDLAHAC